MFLFTIFILLKMEATYNPQLDISLHTHPGIVTPIISFYFN